MVFLMYHELESPGRKPCRRDAGYLRYVVTATDFSAQLASLARAGYRGLSVSEFLASPSATAATEDPAVRERALPAAGGPPPASDSPTPVAPAPSVVFTFDDGCETDLLTAVPLLIDFGFAATFFVVAGFLGRSGYLSAGQVREIGNLKSEIGNLRFEIGCHSMNHADLTRLPLRDLRSEIADAKDKLEQVLGEPVDHFSCPHGRWNPEVARVAREAGYRSVSTSRIGSNTPRSNPYRLNRVAVLRGSSNFLRLCEGHGLATMRFRQVARLAVRSAVGEAAYERLRAGLLR